MSRVAAAKALEAMRTEAVVEAGGAHAPRPGLQIVIQQISGEIMRKSLVRQRRHR